MGTEMGSAQPGCSHESQWESPCGVGSKQLQHRQEVKLYIYIYIYYFIYFYYIWQEQVLQKSTATLPGSPDDDDKLALAKHRSVDKTPKEVSPAAHFPL